MFRVTAAVEIECFQIKTIFSKKYQIGVPFAKLVDHRAHIIVLVNNLKAISLCQKRKYSLVESDAKYRDFSNARYISLFAISRQNT